MSDLNSVRNTHILVVAVSSIFLAVLLMPAGLDAAEVVGDDILARAEQHLAAQDPEGALEIISPILGRKPKNAAALLLRSEARFQLGETQAARKDLMKALELDPDLRQGWLNLAGLHLAEANYDQALEAFAKAQAIDPTAPDNELNEGTVLLLQGRTEEATRSFSAYLRRQQSSAAAYLLVASNYAHAGLKEAALQALGYAIALDERARLQARSDPNFGDLEQDPRFQELLLTDSYQPPAGAHRAQREFSVAYEGVDGALLQAALDAIQLSGRPLHSGIEVTPNWTLLWTDFRVKISPLPGDRCRLELSAPAERFTAADWKRTSEEMFKEVSLQMLLRQR